MTTETQVYRDLNEAKTAKLRSGTRHLNRWRPVHTDVFGTRGKIRITWNNDPDPPPPPKRQLTQRQFIDELADERSVRLT